VAQETRERADKGTSEGVRWKSGRKKWKERWKG